MPGLYRLLVFLLLLLTSGLAVAQQYPVVKYTVREGLVQNQVLSLLKDSRGYVWCGTWYGLSRFNGETFENYTEAEGLWNSGVRDLSEDKEGNIWVSNGSRLARFDGKTFKKFTLPTDSPSETGFSGKTDPVQIVDRTKGVLLEVKGDTLLPVRLPNFPDGRKEDLLYHPSSETYYWIADQQVVSYHDGRLKIVTEKSNWQQSIYVIHDKLHLIRKSEDGTIEDYTVEEGKLSPYLKRGETEFEVLRPLKYPFLFEHRNSLYYLPPSSLKAERISEKPPGYFQFKSQNQKVTSLLWIPTEKGLWGLTLTGFKNFDEDEVPYAWHVVEDQKGNFLFSSYGKGVQKYDGEKLTTISRSNYHALAVKAYKPLGFAPASDGWYYRAFRDQEGYCWLPNAAGIYRYKEDRWNFIRKSTYNLAFSIAEDVARRKVVAASYGHFYTVDIDPPFRTDSVKGTSRLFDGLVFCAVVSPAGNYWLSGRGIDRYNPDTKKFTSYTFENKKLPTKGARMLYFDWNGCLWAGDDGILCRYDPKKDVFEEVFDFRFQGLIGFVEQIDSDHLMISDLKNLYVLNLKKFNASGEVDIKTFNHHNGFMGVEPGQLGSYRDSKGHIWITSSSVLSVLDPAKLDLTSRPLRTYITSLNKRGVSFVHPDELVEVPEGESIVNIKAETLGEDKPYNSQFSYQLEGEIDDWTDWQEQPLITLSNLSNGVHTLRVRSRTGDFNAHDDSIATLRFRTKVAFWKSPNFYLYASLVGLFLLIALGLLWQRDRRKGRALLTQQRLLEKRERTLRLLQAQTIQSQMSPHFTSNVLGAIQHQILNNEPERASDNLVKLSRLSRAYLDDSLMENGHDSFLTRDIPLGREVRLLTMYVELMQLWHQDCFNFVLDIQSSLKLEDHTIPPFLIQPFVENAIEHGLKHRSAKGILRVEFMALADEVLVCQIEDDGIGREAARLQQHQVPKEFTSVSTNLSQQRAALLNQLGYAIQIKIEDRVEGTGTVVTVQIGYT